MGLIGRDLRFYHIVISASFEHLLDEILTKMPSRKRPREKHAKRCELDVQVAPNTTELSDSSDVDEGFVIERTFLCEAPKLRGVNSVVQSTNEHLRIVNPRR